MALRRLAVLGVLHAAALPGTPRSSLPLAQIIDRTCQEAETYRDAGLDGLIIENMHDLPYTVCPGPEITAAMTAVSAAVRRTCPRLPLGVQILCAANQQATAVALAAGLDFIRVEGFVFSHVADEGIINACAGDLLRYRKQIGAENIQIFADIKKKHSYAPHAGLLYTSFYVLDSYLGPPLYNCKRGVLGEVLHRWTKDCSFKDKRQVTDVCRNCYGKMAPVTISAHALTADVSVAETARAAELFLADGVVLTGTATAAPADPQELKEVKRAVKIPVLIGSGVTLENVKNYMDANALIIGSYFKKEGYWANGVDPDRVNRFMDHIRKLRE